MDEAEIRSKYDAGTLHKASIDTRISFISDSSVLTTLLSHCSSESINSKYAVIYDTMPRVVLICPYYFRTSLKAKALPSQGRKQNWWSVSEIGWIRTDSEFKLAFLIGGSHCIDIIPSSFEYYLLTSIATGS